MTRGTREGSDAEQVARILREHDRRLSDIERSRNVDSNEIDLSETENGFLVDSNVTVEVYETGDDPDIHDPITVSETHNEATEFADLYLATCLKHNGNYPLRPEEFAFSIGDEQFVGSTPISESYVDDADTVMTGYLDSTELNGHTLKEIAVRNADGRFNLAPLEPEIEKSPARQITIKVRFVFLHA